MPNKTIYVSDGDLPLYQRAQELAGDNLSAAISAALRRYVELEEGRREGFDEIVVRVGLGKGRKVRFTGVLLGEWVSSTSSRYERFRGLPRPQGQVRLHIERGAGFTMVDDEGKPAGWRGHLGIGNVSYGSTPWRVDPRSRRDAGRAARPHPAQLYDMVAGTGPAGPRGGPRHLGLTAITSCAWEPGHDGRQRAASRSRSRDFASRMARRSSSMASTSRSRRAPSSPCSDSTVPARRRWSGSCRH